MALNWMGYNPEINDVIEYDMKDKRVIQQGDENSHNPKMWSVGSVFSASSQQLLFRTTSTSDVHNI